MTFHPDKQIWFHLLLPTTSSLANVDFLGPQFLCLVMKIMLLIILWKSLLQNEYRILENGSHVLYIFLYFLSLIGNSKYEYYSIKISWFDMFKDGARTHLSRTLLIVQLRHLFSIFSWCTSFIVLLSNEV